MTEGFRRACLALAVVIGCAWSAFQILHDIRMPMQLLSGVAARVNGHQIDADSVNRTVAGMDARMRHSEDGARHEVLARMIDEELLVQHALDSGAAATNPEVRAALVRSAITRVNSEAAAEPMSDTELSGYFQAHKEVYATAASFDVTPVYFAAGEAIGATASETVGAAGGGTTAPTLARAAAARSAIEAGASLDAVGTTADPLPFRSPGRRVSLRTLANYFGPAIADAIDHVAVGHATNVTRLGDGAIFIYLNNKTPGEIPPLATIRDLVAADAQRDRQEHALETLLASLKQSAHIEFAASPNPTPPVAASR